jgi:hypothetical protein
MATTRTRVGVVAWLALAGGIAGAMVACGNSTQSGGSSEDGGDDGSQSADGSLGTDAPMSDATQGQDGTTGDGATGNDAHGMNDGTSGDAEGGSVNDGGSADAFPDATPDALPDAADGTAPEAGTCSQVSTDAYAPCNSLCNTGPVVPVVYSTQVPPAATGGTPLAGSYYATAVTYYFAPDSGVEAGTSSETFQETAFLSVAQPVSTSQSVVSVNGKPNETNNSEFALSGSDLLVTQTCDSPGQLAVPYSASGNTVTIYLPQQTGSNGPYWAAATLTLQSPADAGTLFEAGPAADASCPQTFSDAQAVCTPICNGASTINVVGVAASAPAPTGGPLLDGTYYLTARSDFEGADSGADGGTVFTVQETIVVTTTNGVTILQDIQSRNGGAQDTTTIAVVASGNQLYFTGLCPQSIQGPQYYSASGNTLKVYDTHGVTSASIQESVFTKQ